MIEQSTEQSPQSVNAEMYQMLAVATGQQVLKEKMLENVKLAYRQLRAVAKAEIGSIVFTKHVVGAEHFLARVSDLQRTHELLTRTVSPAPEVAQS